MDDRGQVLGPQQDVIGQEPRHLAGVLGPRIGPQQSELQPRPRDDRMERRELGRVQPFAQAAHLVDDLFRGADLVIVEPVQGVLLAVGAALGGRLGRNHRVDLTNEVQVHGRWLLRRGQLAQVVGGPLVGADLLIGRDQRHIADDPLVDGRLEFGVRQHHPIQGVVVE